jgi:hypothetical protein
MSEPDKGVGTGGPFVTTPGGVANLPNEALTLDNMAARLQDMSGTAMRDRAVQKFPAIMDGSTGLSPALAFTPFGLLVGIWAQVNSLIANADPADVQGPEDLPDLVLEFIQGLPLVGQFIGILEAVLGNYDGDDQNLLALQEFFSPVRVLMQLFSGITEGIPDPAQLTAFVTQFLGAFEGLDLSDPGAVIATILQRISQLAVGPLINAITNSNWAGQDPGSLPAVLNPWVRGVDVGTQLAHGAWDFSSQALAGITQIAQQAASAPVLAWTELLNALQFWTLGWFANTYNTQQQTTTNTADIGLLFAALNGATASIYYKPAAGRPLTAGYIGPDGKASGVSAFTQLSGAAMIRKTDDQMGGDADFAVHAAWFTGNPMAAPVDHGLITDRFHVEVTLASIPYGLAGFFVCGAVSGTTLGNHVMCEIGTQSYGDSIALATYTGVNAGRTQRFAVATNNGMTKLQIGDVIAVEYDDAGQFVVLLNGRSLHPDGQPDGWYDSAKVVGHGPGKREIGLYNLGSGAAFSEMRGYDIPATTAVAPIVTPRAIGTVYAPAPRINGRISVPAPTAVGSAPPPTIGGAPITLPVAPGGKPPMGFIELQPQLATTADAKARAAKMYADATQLRAKYWRIMAAWNYVVKAQDPGTATFDVENNVPTTTNRNWSTIDCCVNDILLTGAEVVMIIGQDRPGTRSLFGSTPFPWVSAATYGDFAAEVAARYKPGGLGIRTDGKYAANAGRGVRFFECWNEQNSTAFWGKPTNPIEYTDYLKSMFTKVKAVPGMGGSSSLILYGGLQHITRNAYAAQWTWAGIPEIDFVKQCWAYEPNLGEYFDVMADHVYPGSDATTYPPGGATTIGPVPAMTIDNMQQLKEIHELMVAKNCDKPIWITEAGYSNDTLSETQSRDYIAALYELLATLPYVKVVIWWNLANLTTDPRDHNGNYGFTRFDGSRKPVFDWMLSFANVAAPTALGVGTAPTPAVVTPIPVLAATAALTAPAPTIAAPIAAPRATAALSCPTPIVVNPVISPAPSAAANAPTPIIVNRVLAPAALLAAAAGLPVIVNPVIAPAAAAAGSAPTPVSITTALTAPAATATLTAPDPRLDQRVATPAATGAGSAPTPIVVNPVIAPAAAAALSAPAVTAENRVTAPASTAALSGPAPIVENRVTAPPATATAAAPAPQIIAPQVTATAATADANSPSNIVVIDIISAPAATGTGDASAPSVLKTKAFWVGVTPAHGGGTLYNTICPTRQMAWQSVESGTNTDVRVPLSEQCIITKITLWVTTAPGTGNSWVMKLRADGADAGPSVTIADSATTATWTGRVNLAQLALLGVAMTGFGLPASPGDVYWTIEYETDGAYFLMPSANLNYSSVASGTLYNPPSGGSNIAPPTSGLAVEELIPAACTVTRLAAYAIAAPGAGNTNTYYARRGVTSATDSAFSAAVTGTNGVAVSGAGAALSLAAGDTLVIKEVKGPNSAWSRVSTCVTVRPTTAGQMFLTFGNTNAPSTSAVNYEQPTGTGNNGWTATETAVRMRINACAISSLISRLTTAPGSGKSRTFRARLNAADTTVTSTASGTGVAGASSGAAATAADGDFLTVGTTPAGTPAATAGVKTGMVLIPA